MKIIEKDDIRYALHTSGQRIELEMEEDKPATPRRKPFETQWVKVSKHWMETLRQAKSKSAYTLALDLLAEEFRRRRIGGEIVLSSAVSPLPPQTRREAAQELAALGLIRLEREGRGCRAASRVQILNARPTVQGSENARPTVHEC
jgi:hypothetical protein